MEVSDSVAHILLLGSQSRGCDFLPIVTFALDGEHPLSEVPLITWPRTAAPELIGIRLAKLAAPLTDGLIGQGNATFTQQLFHIPEAQTESKVQPDRVADNLHRKAVILIFGGGRRCVHALITSYQTAASQASQEVDNALMRTSSFHSSRLSGARRNGPKAMMAAGCSIVSL
jgi:hypothetical protein